LEIPVAEIVLYCIRTFIQRRSQHKAIQKRFSVRLAPRKQAGFNKS